MVLSKRFSYGERCSAQPTFVPKLVIFTLFFGFFITPGCFSKVIATNELIKLIKTKPFVVALFTKKDCDDFCQLYTQKLSELEDKLIDYLSAEVVQISDSPLRKQYTNSNESALVFYRNGVPLLYDGSMDQDEILDFFNSNKEPAVIELTDETFEHLTQASTGATTGDWFVMFYTNECVECQHMVARWESVGAKLKFKINIARVNKDTTGASTARRFNVLTVPEFILFRHGKMYRYRIPKYNIKAFMSFATDWYKNLPSEKVSTPQSPFDDLILMIVDFLHKNTWIMKLASITIAATVIVVAASMLRKKSEIPQKTD